MKTPHVRKLIRWIHLIGAAAIGTYVYAPFREVVWFTVFMQLVVLPSLTLSGLWLWKGHSFRKKASRQLKPVNYSAS